MNDRIFSLRAAAKSRGGSAAPPAGVGQEAVEPAADLARIIVISADRSVPTAQREALIPHIATISDTLVESCVLHTCHRVELIGLLQDAGSPAPAIPGTRLSTGIQATDRVFAVAAGLDSAVVAEEQLLGQVREAYASALAARRTGPILNELLRRAIRVGKRSRSMARPGMPRSLAGKGLEWALGTLDGAVSAEGEAARALVLGTGEVGREVAVRLAGSGLAVTVASADLKRAARVVELLGGEPHRAANGGALSAGSWSVVVAATRIAEPILRLEHAPALSSARVLDLCAPPAVAGELRPVLGDRLLDLDHLAEEDDAPVPLPPAAARRLTEMMRHERDGFVAWLAERASADAIGLLHRHADALRERHLDRLRRHAIVDEGQLAAVDHMARAMLAELLHAPTVELRRGGEDAERVRKMLGLDA